MTSPLISIIVPTYNCYFYLKACLEKLSHFKGEAIEVIVINDGSSDETENYLNTLTIPYFKIVHQENGGVSNARNLGLKLVKGKYIYFCDSDDEIIPEKFLEILEDMNTNDYDIVVCNFLNQNSDLASTRTYYKRSRTGLFTGPEFLLYSLIHKEYGSEPVQFLVKRDFYNEAQFVVGILHEDDQIFPRLIFQAKIVLVTNEAIYFRKFRLGSLSRDEFNVPRNNAKDLKFVIETSAKELIKNNSLMARKVFKTLQLRSWLMLFDQAQKRPHEADREILNNRPTILSILMDKDIPWRYRLRYIKRSLKT